jgi:hypothetical protein
LPTLRDEILGQGQQCQILFSAMPNLDEPTIGRTSEGYLRVLSPEVSRLDAAYKILFTEMSDGRASCGEDASAQRQHAAADNIADRFQCDLYLPTGGILPNNTDRIRFRQREHPPQRGLWLTSSTRQPYRQRRQPRRPSTGASCRTAHGWFIRGSPTPSGFPAM